MASAEEVLLQFTAEDEISSVVSDIESTVSSSIDTIIELMSEVNSSIEDVSSNAEAVAEAFDNIESPEISFEVDTSPIEEANEMIEELSQDVDIPVNVDTSQIDDAVSSKEELNQDTGFSADVDSSGLDGALSAMGAMEVANFGWDALERAGRVSDSWNRLELTFKDTGVSMDELREKSSQLSDETGKSGSAVREWFNTMGIVGVTNTQLLSDAFTSMSGRAYQTGTSIENVESSVQRMALTGNAGARFLSRLGLSTKQLADAMGVTEEEMSNAFKDLSVEERLQVLTKAMGDGKEANEMYKQSWEGLQERASVAMGGIIVAIGQPILEMIVPVMETAIDIIHKFGDAFKGLPAPVRTAVSGVVAGAIGLTTFAGMLPVFSKAIKGFQTGFGILNGVVGKLPVIGSKFAKFGNEAKTVVKTASGTGSLAGQASTAGTGMKATSVSLKGIGQGALSMVAPMIEIAIAIAILLPIIAGIVAEAMLLLKGLQLLLDALDFDKIDLSGTVEALKQLGIALFEVGVAMGALTFASLMTTLSLVVSGVTQLLNPIQVAGDLLIQASKELEKFKDVQIDESISEKLQLISRALGGISNAMMSLTNVVLTLAFGNLLTLGGALGTISGAMATARTEIINASNEIAKIKDLPDIEDGAVQKLEKISKAIDSVATAISGLRSIRDGYNWDSFVQGIFGGVNIQTALENVKQDIIDAGNSLQQYTGLPDIPQGVGDKLKKIADALEGVSSAFQSLRSIRDNYNWDSYMGGIFKGVDIQTAIANVKTDILKAGNSLNGLTSLPDIPEGVDTKLKRISTVLEAVGSTLETLRGVRDAYNWDSFIQGIFGGVDIPTAINNSRTTLIRSANALSTLQSLPEIPEGITTKANAIKNTTSRVGSILTSMQSVQFPNVIGMAMIPVNIAMAKVVLQSTATQLQGLASLPPLPEGLSENVRKIGTSARSVASAVMGINAIPFVGPDVAFRVGLAVSAVKSTASELSKLQGTTMGGGISAILNSVATAVRQLRATLSAMSGGFRANGVQIGSSLRGGIRAGMTGLNGVVTGAVASAGNSGKATGFTYGQGIGGRMKSGFQAQFKIASIVSAEMQNVVNAINSGGANAVSAISSVASQMVQEFRNKLDTHSPGIIANTTRDEMGYTTGYIVSQGKNVVSAVGNVARGMVNSFNPTLSASLSGGFNQTQLDSARGMTTNAISGGSNAYRPVNIIINEGAIQLDARNLTTKESRQVMINAIEGLDVVKGIDVRGV